MYTHGTGKGFRDWKCATGHKGALMKHSRSFTHSDAVVAQCYDGVAVMSGSCPGVQAKVMEAPTAIYTHSCAHRLNLVLVDSVKQCTVAEDFFALLESLYVCFSFTIFMKKQAELKPGQQPHQLKRLSETQWACQYDVIHAIKATYTSL